MSSKSLRVRRIDSRFVSFRLPSCGKHEEVRRSAAMLEDLSVMECVNVSLSPSAKARMGEAKRQPASVVVAVVHRLSLRLV